MKRYMRPEEKSWRRSVRDLDTHPAAQWNVLGLLSAPEKHPNAVQTVCASWRACALVVGDRWDWPGDH